MSQRHRMSELDSDLHILSQRLSEYVEVGMENTISLGQNVAEFCEEDEALKQKTRDIMTRYVAMGAEIKQYVNAINHIKATTSRTDGGQDLLAVFEAKLAELRTTDTTDAATHPKFVELEEELASQLNMEAQLESLRQSLLGNTEDDEVALTQTEVNIKCPYTSQQMVDPVRNVLCSHVYEREGILGHIRAKKNKAKCPVGGCGNKEPIKESHLEEHRELKRYIVLLSKIKS